MHKLCEQRQRDYVTLDISKGALNAEWGIVALAENKNVYNNAIQLGEEWLGWTQTMELKSVNLNLGFNTEWDGDGSKNRK